LDGSREERPFYYCFSLNEDDRHYAAYRYYGDLPDGRHFGTYVFPSMTSYADFKDPSFTGVVIVEKNGKMQTSTPAEQMHLQPEEHYFPTAILASPSGKTLVWITEGELWSWHMVFPKGLFLTDCGEQETRFGGRKVRDARMHADGILEVLLEDGETFESSDGSACVDMDPPESIVGVSRKLGIRWIQLLPSNPRDQMAMTSWSLPTTYSYGFRFEKAPSGKDRMVGEVLLNGNAYVQIRVFMNHRLPKYSITDNMAISPLYHDAILYSLAVAICEKYKLKDYQPEMERQKDAALAVIDVNTLNNRALNSGLVNQESYMDSYFNGLGGNGLSL
jgi:hypothetical protein